MKRPLVIILLFILISIINLKAQEPEQWVLFESPVFNYSLFFPSKPVDNTEIVETEAGELKLNVVELDCTGAKGYNNLVYMVNCTVYPDSLINSDFKDILDNFFDGTVNGAATNVGGEIISSKITEYAGFPGREVRISADNGNSVFISRLYLIKSQFFMMIILTSADKKDNPDINKFFHSFKYTGTTVR